jgi:hypothetical protein
MFLVAQFWVNTQKQNTDYKDSFNNNQKPVYG